VVGVASIWMVHDWPDKARFLTPLEKEMVLLRLKSDTGLASEGKFSWRMVGKAAKDWKVSWPGFGVKLEPSNWLTVTDVLLDVRLYWMCRANLLSIVSYDASK
jgi:hypothetical protein